MTHKLHRRTFTKLGLLSGGVLVFPSIGSASALERDSVDLTPEERDLIERFAEIMLPTEGTALKPRSEVPVVDNVAHALSLLDATMLEEVRVGLKLFDYGAIFIGLHFARFSNLTAERRIEYIHRWENGFDVQRGIVGVLKKLTYVGYWADIDAGRAIGYPGPVSVAGGVPSLGNAPMPGTG